MSHPLIIPSTAPEVYNVESVPSNKQYVTEALCMREVLTLRGDSWTEVGLRRTVDLALVLEFGLALDEVPDVIPPEVVFDDAAAVEEVEVVAEVEETVEVEESCGV
jgi:hypothetical protein